MLSVQELRSSTGKELLQELAKAQTDLQQIRIAVRTKHEKDTGKVKKQRHYVAQLKTILKEIELEAAIDTVTRVD